MQGLLNIEAEEKVSKKKGDRSKSAKLVEGRKTQTGGMAKLYNAAGSANIQTEGGKRSGISYFEANQRVCSKMTAEVQKADMDRAFTFNELCFWVMDQKSVPVGSNWKEEEKKIIERMEKGRIENGVSETSKPYLAQMSSLTRNRKMMEWVDKNCSKSDASSLSAQDICRCFETLILQYFAKALAEKDFKSYLYSKAPYVVADISTCFEVVETGWKCTLSCLIWGKNNFFWDDGKKRLYWESDSRDAIKKAFDIRSEEKSVPTMATIEGAEDVGHNFACASRINPKQLCENGLYKQNRLAEVWIPQKAAGLCREIYMILGSLKIFQDQLKPTKHLDTTEWMDEKGSDGAKCWYKAMSLAGQGIRAMSVHINGASRGGKVNKIGKENVMDYKDLMK